MYLAWTRTRGGLSVLSIILGVTKSKVSIWLRYTRRILIKVLQHHPLAKIEIPSDDEIAEFVRVISEKYPHVGSVWGAMDGLKLYLQSAGDTDTQNTFYNGWQHNHFVNSLFLFAPDGTICMKYINAPGTVHDSSMATWGSLYDMLDEIYYRTGAQVVIDSAFARENRPSLVKSAQNKSVDAAGNVRGSFRASSERPHLLDSFPNGGCMDCKDPSPD